MNFLLVLFVIAFSSIAKSDFLNQRKIGPRIIGGITATAAEFPFAAAITIQTATGRYVCGGTLLNNEWILTAGQCVDGATLFTIQLGSIYLSGEDSNRVTVASSEYVLHPDYDPNTLENDLGLIKLRMPVDYTTYMKQIDVLGTYDVPAGVHLLAIGWGQTSDDDSDSSNNLLKAYVSSLSNDECKLYYGNQISNNTICIEGNYNEGICYGDTGSGLIQDLGRGQKMIVGVASFISGNGCESTDPSGFVRTFPYRDWIRSIINA